VLCFEEFEPISEADLAYFAAEAERLYTESDRAIFADFGGTGFGDIALVPAAWRRLPPKGIRADVYSLVRVGAGADSGLPGCRL
jgi:hypothetical protein